MDVARLTASSLYAKLTVADCTLIQEQENNQSYCLVPSKKLKEHFPQVEIFPFLSCRSAVSTGIFLYGKADGDFRVILSNQQYDGHVHIIAMQSQNTKDFLFVCVLQQMKKDPL